MRILERLPEFIIELILWFFIAALLFGLFIKKADAAEMVNLSNGFTMTEPIEDEFDRPLTDLETCIMFVYDLSAANPSQPVIFQYFPANPNGGDKHTLLTPPGLKGKAKAISICKTFSNQWSPLSPVVEIYVPCN